MSMNSITITDREIWQPVVGYEGMYEVSNYGHVRSIDRVVPHPSYGIAVRKGQEIKPQLGRRGYLLVPLHQNGKLATKAVHRLVAEAFIGPRPDKHQINHIDCSKQNNSLPNLEYVTRSENMKHAYANGLIVVPYCVGDKHYNAKLTADDVVGVRKRRSTGESYCSIAADYGVGRKTISDACEFKTWRHVNG